MSIVILSLKKQVNVLLNVQNVKEIRVLAANKCLMEIVRALNLLNNSLKNGKLQQTSSNVHIAIPILKLFLDARK